MTAATIIAIYKNDDVMLVCDDFNEVRAIKLSNYEDLKEAAIDEVINLDHYESLPTSNLASILGCDI